MSLLIKHPLNLGQQTFRINRGVPQGYDKKGNVIYGFRPGYWREVGCQDIDCPKYTNGWTTTVDTSTELGQAQAQYIRKRSGRKFREERTALTLVHFIFESGQICFDLEKHREDHHMVPEQRDPVFVNSSRKGHQLMEYDQFFETMNEVSTQRNQKRRVF